ncbi:hypothetical protein [Brevibacillus fortis]
MPTFLPKIKSKELVRAMNDLGIHALDSDKKMGVLSGGERFKYPG